MAVACLNSTTPPKMTLGMSTSGLNYCLNALIAKGLVKVSNFSQSKNKFRYIYMLTLQGIAEKGLLIGRFLKRKMAEYEQLRSEIDGLIAEEGEPALFGPNSSLKNAV